MSGYCRVSGCQGKAEQQYMGACASCFAKVQELSRQKAANQNRGSEAPTPTRTARYARPDETLAPPPPVAVPTISVAKPKPYEARISVASDGRKTTTVLQKGQVTNILTEHPRISQRRAPHSTIHEIFYDNSGIKTTTIIQNCRKVIVKERDGRILVCEIEDVSIADIQQYLQEAPTQV